MRTYIKYWIITLVVFWMLVQSAYFVLTVFFSDSNDSLGERVGDYMDLAVPSPAVLAVLLAVSTLLATLAWLFGAKSLRSLTSTNEAEP